MNKRIEDMTDKDIKEYIESDEGRAALRCGADLGMKSIMKSLSRNQEQSLKHFGVEE
jgi:hypothetical protein